MTAAGKTQIGGEEFPRAPVLTALLASMSDGEVFYHVRNGIRNTGMPAWDLPDREIWQLVLHMRNLPKTAPLPAGPVTDPSNGTDTHYVGSASCKGCHAEIYERWRKTPMANVVRDPHEHPDALIPDFSKPDPLLTFSKDDVAFTYGSVWKQRYFKKVGDDYFPLPAQWDITHKVWRPYFVKNGTDWWSTLFPPDNNQRPTGQLCDGCHSVNYDIATKTVAEWNVGCESCHGPASGHVKNPVRETVINPARLDYVKANDTCIQCHSQGQPPAIRSMASSMTGRSASIWVPISAIIGAWKGINWAKRLSLIFRTAPPTRTACKAMIRAKPDVYAGRYLLQLPRCSRHPEFSGAAQTARANLHVLPRSEHPKRPAHRVARGAYHHKADSAGSQCVSCHMPKIEQTIADVNVHAHTFRVVVPSETDSYQIPNSCNGCHADKSTEWASAALKTWKTQSPWRLEK